MRCLVLLTIVLAGCGASRFRTEHVGTVQVGGGTSIPLGRGNYQMAMRFDVPRAQVVAWTLQCPGIERTGVTGETFENYRTRRLAELQRMVEQDRRNLATVTNAVAGQAGATVQVQGPGTSVRADAQASGEVVAEHAIQEIRELPYGDVGAGSYTAKTSVQTFEDGACTVTTQSIDPVGGALAIDRIRDLEGEKQERLVAQRTNALDARTRVRAHLVTSGADEHARERRLAEQARLREEEMQRRKELEAKAAAEREAERVARARRSEENRLRVEAEARLRWEVEAPERARLALLEKERSAREAERTVVIEEERRERQVILERERREKIVIIERERRERLLIIERQRTAALTVRGSYVAWLVGTCGADPHRYARVQRERIERERLVAIEIEERERRIEIERIERERRIEIERSSRMAADREREQQLEAERQRIERDRQARTQRQLQGALAARAQLTGYLVSAGARMRPPRPAALVEVAGAAPFDGARWESGAWVWSQGTWQWQWRQGGWVDSVQFGEAGGEAIVRAPTVVHEAPVQTTTTTSTTTSTSVDVGIPSGVTIGGPQGSISIDVLPVAPRATKPTTRDHRRRDAKEEPRTRDHRRR